MSGPGMGGEGFGPDDRLASVRLDEGAAPARSPELQQELDVALYDLGEENRCRPVAEAAGPFALVLAREERALRLEIADAAGRPVAVAALPVSAVRDTVADYAAVCERYYGAVRRLPPAEIEAIDADRKAIHDEGAALVAERLAPAVRLDHRTARRLFTVVAVLCPPV